MNAKKIRRQHYVWRKYLEPWCTNGKVWCRRGTNMFNTEPMNVGQERDFYSPQPLNTADKRFLEMDAESTGKPELVEFIKDEISLREEMFAEMERAKRRQDPNEISELEAIIHNSEEGYQGRIESQGTPYLNALVAGDTTWAGDDAHWQNFILFYATQYLRTKRIQEKLKALLEPQAQRLGYSVDRVWPISRIIETARLADNIYRSASLILLENGSGLEFITGDQPTFNAKAIDQSLMDAVPEAHELYYPVSPNHAILLVCGSTRCAPLTRSAFEKEVQDYNDVIRRSALEQVYARTREQL